MRHKPEKRNVISDALSRLANINDQSESPGHVELDMLYVYTATLIEMNNDFKRRIVKGYRSDSSWIKVFLTLNKETLYDENVAKLFFVLREIVIFDSITIEA